MGSFMQASSSSPSSLSLPLSVLLSLCIHISRFQGEQGIAIGKARQSGGADTHQPSPELIDRLVIIILCAHDKQSGLRLDARPPLVGLEKTEVVLVLLLLEVAQVIGAEARPASGQGCQNAGSGR